MTITQLDPVHFPDGIHKPKDLSAVEAVGEFLVLGSDETNLVQILRREGDAFRVVGDEVLDSDVEELDIEGISHEADLVYVICSHSCKRAKVKADESYVRNREALATVKSEPSRDRLFRFRLGPDGRASHVNATSLRPFLDANETLRRFRHIPSKENGIDIEGVAVRDGWLRIGFRGPVLRGNWVPVLKCLFATPISDANLLYVNLGGSGVRDLLRVGSGFLILSGPVGDGPGVAGLYHWDGEDCLPGTRTSGSAGRLVPLGELPPNATGAKPEAITLLAEDDTGYELLVTHDGVKNGDPTRYRVGKPT